MKKKTSEFNGVLTVFGRDKSQRKINLGKNFHLNEKGNLLTNYEVNNKAYSVAQSLEQGNFLDYKLEIL